MSPRTPRDFPGKKQDLRATTAERLEAIVEAAERAAEGVIDDAEAQARRYLAQARAEADRVAEDRVAELSDLVDSLLGQAVSLRREAVQLQATLEEAKARLDGGEQPQRLEPSAEPSVPRLRAVEEADPAAPGEEAAPRGDARSTDAAGARLLATQMAVSGSSREEIELRLRNGFQIEDADAILDAILGPEG
jgi:vacuolar-type H+-ATPase subunit H